MSLGDTTAHPSTNEPGDAALISRVRAGDVAAYGLLCERHAEAAHVLARRLFGDEGAAGDAIAETFRQILGVLCRGGGPQVGLRTYLLVSLRRTAGVRGRDDPPPAPRDGFGPYDDPAEPFVDPALRGLETNMIARAFLSLPERWQAVLWHTEVEGVRPAAVAPLLGLTANGAAGLAYGAREGLRQSYLQLHLAESARRPCRPAVDKLATYIRGGLAERDCARVERHLDGCQECATIYAELADVKTVLRAVVGPLVLGTAAAGYLADVTGCRGRGAVDARAAAAGMLGGFGGLAGFGGLGRAWRQLPRRQRRTPRAGTARTQQ
jgi:DNA-directed RNA polymerase specialized sigma24 family protein